MRKNDLIKLLQEIKGNPEVMLWNGFVGDFQAIGEVQPYVLVKQTRDYYVRLLKAEERRTEDYSKQEMQEINTAYRKTPYEVNEYVTARDIEEGKYKYKTIVAVSAKLSGKSCWDRIGTINY